MKARGFLLFVGLIGLIAFSCKKDISPTVIFTVEDSTGRRLPNARIYTHPCFDGVSCDTTRLNVNFIKDGYTDANGQLEFTYPYSAIIDVIGNWTDCDTSATSMDWCMYVGKTVARFETKRAPVGEENVYNVKIVVKEDRQ